MGFSAVPKLVRGGIVLIESDSGKVLRVIALQYNPDSISRSLQIKGVGGEGGDHSEAMRLKGPPVETIKIEAELDATDKLEKGDADAQERGLHAELALLETLVYPSSTDLLANNSEAQSGSIEIAPMQSALTLFVWSKRRVLPVRFTEFSITEESFDAALNPTRAKVSLGMRVLTVDDVGFAGKGGNLFMSYLVRKEELSASITATQLGPLGITSI
jgi:hypothetical protein